MQLVETISKMEAMGARLRLEDLDHCFALLLPEHHWKFCPRDPQLEYKPPDRRSYSKEQTDDPGHFRSWASGHSDRRFSENDSIQ